MLVDAHQHYWDPARGDYPWMIDAPQSLQRIFGPDDLAPLLAACGITATVLVQAAPTVAETRYLLEMAAATPSVAGVVGWIDFADAQQRKVLEQLAGNPYLVGIRPMVQDIADDTWVLRRDLDWAFAAIAEMDLAFDALGYAKHARPFLQRLERHPDLRVVIDHGMKPDIAQSQFAPWASDLRDLAQHTQALCKLSGLATQALPGSGTAALQPYMEYLLDIFGPQRLMWGSDWPVASPAIAYADWFDACQRLLCSHSEAQRQRVFGLNAVDFYQLRHTGEAPWIPEKPSNS